MKILNVNHTLDPVMGGGTAERTVQMSRHLIARGMDCMMLTTDVGKHPERISAEVAEHITVLPMLWRRFYVPRCSWKQLSDIVAEADIIHLMGHWTLLNALVYWAARKQGKPYVFCPAGALSIFGRSRVLKAVYNWVVGHKIVTNAIQCIAITLDEKEQFLQRGVEEKKIIVLPNGVNEEDFVYEDDAAFRQKYGLGDRRLILFVGRLNAIKGPDLLLQAFCQIKEDIPDYDLVLVGPDGGLKNQLEKIVQEYDATQRVRFLGYLGGAEKSWAFHSADMLVIPSRQEAMSIVVLEAGVCGAPALFTDRCGLNEIAESGIGWKAAPTVEGLADGLRRALLPRSRPAPEAIREYMKRHYSWTTIAERYSLLYKNLLDGK